MRLRDSLPFLRYVTIVSILFSTCCIMQFWSSDAGYQGCRGNAAWMFARAYGMLTHEEPELHRCLPEDACNGA